VGVFGQVFMLVVVAIAFAALGAYIHPVLSATATRVCILCALAMPLIAAFGGERFRGGLFAISWLLVLAVLIGLLVGPAAANLVTVNEDALVEAVCGSALTVFAMGFPALNIPGDLARWMYPLSLVVLVGVTVSVMLFLLGAHTYPWISVVIFTASAGLVAVYINYMQRRISQVRPVAVAIGVFVTVVNVFVSLLNLTSAG
jgi:modulator of FtsH protease